MSAARLRAFKIKPLQIGKCLRSTTAQKTKAGRFATHTRQKTAGFTLSTRKTAVHRARAMLRLTRRRANISILWIPTILPSRRCLPIWLKLPKSTTRSWSFPGIILILIIRIPRNIRKSRVLRGKFMLPSRNSAKTLTGCLTKTCYTRRGISCIPAIISANTSCIFPTRSGMIFRSI